MQPGWQRMSGVGDMGAAYLHTAADRDADICLAPGFQLQHPAGQQNVQMGHVITVCRASL